MGIIGRASACDLRNTSRALYATREIHTVGRARPTYDTTIGTHKNRKSTYDIYSYAKMCRVNPEKKRTRPYIIHTGIAVWYYGERAEYGRQVDLFMSPCTI